MDEREKNIRELEEKRREDQRDLDQTLTGLGAAFLARAGEQPQHGLPAPELREEYQQLNQEIAASEDAIKAVEGDVLHLRHLEENIQLKEQEAAERNRELADRYILLGKRLLDSGADARDAGAYRQQLDALRVKITSLEERLDVLDGKGDSNVLAWIGKNAQSVVLRSFLGRNQGNLQRIYQAAGEQFSQTPPESAEFDESAAAMRAEIAERCGAQSALAEETAQLKETRRKISASFSGEGNPGRKIQNLERHILHIKERLKALCLRYGGHIEEAAAEIPSCLEGEDTPRLEQIRELRESIADYDRRIEKLKAALAIDGARAEIVKLERAIVSQRARIAASETAIDQCQRKIAGLNDHIQELQQKI
ncbi:MAG: hypothetical protein LBD08_01945 [Treponema sp.]|jgi:chromosome segregation ATPase|nr:hypothetical protein [Treponema sp.]